MYTRRQFLQRTLEGSSLVALGATVPGFITSTAAAAEQGKDNILVVVEMTGGNDGLNTVIPYGDDLYYKARPSLRFKKEDVLTIDDHIGLNPSLRGFNTLLENDKLAIVQGVGYPNANRSHFESMDIWQSADPRNKTGNGWLGRTLAELKVEGGRIPAFHIGAKQLPLAMQGSAVGVPSLNSEKPFGLDLINTFYGHQPDGSVSNAKKSASTRKELIESVAKHAPSDDGGLLQFVKRISLDAYASIDSLKSIMNEKFEVPDPDYDYSKGFREIRSGLSYELMLVSRMIQAGFGTRIFYVSIDGFDTHGSQREDHANLLRSVGDAISNFFEQLNASGDEERVLVMTYSEFGRRVAENGSKGTDHGAGSCMFVAGPSVKSGLIGEHPSLEDLDSGDLKFHTDFRQVYATLLDKWLQCDSQQVLSGQFKHIPLLA